MKRILYVLAMVALPRVYMLDWSNTPSEMRENYISSSSDLIMPTNDGHVVFMADMVTIDAEGDECEESENG